MLRYFSICLFRVHSIVSSASPAAVTSCTKTRRSDKWSSSRKDYDNVRRNVKRNEFFDGCRSTYSDESKRRSAVSARLLNAGLGCRRHAVFRDSSSVEHEHASQREQFNQHRKLSDKAVLHRDGVAGAILSPLPKAGGYYDGMDSDAVDRCPVSPEERRQRLRRALEERALSVVEITHGGEDDIELNGLPAEEYHGQEGWTTVASDSALYNAVLSRSELDSRRRLSSWGAAIRHDPPSPSLFTQAEEECSARNSAASGAQSVVDIVDSLSAARRRSRSSNAGYSNSLEGELLAATMASVSQPRSVYALRKLYVDGLFGYQGVVSRAEEAEMSHELLQLLQDSRAAYIAEESRYCVNLYEKELGIPGKDTLAFALSRAPTLQKVLYRFFALGLIPSPPNVCQVSEMIGTYSGYPVHHKPRAIGSYYGILNLVSPSIMHLQHNSCPWFPRIYMQPRSLFVVSEPCLNEYSIGYKFTHQPFHAFDYAMRVSKDYRLEVMFALTETEHMPRMHEALQLTEYAHAKMNKIATKPNEKYVQTLPFVPPVAESTDAWLQSTRTRMHREEAVHSTPCSAVSGHEVHKQFVQHRLTGRPIGSSLTEPRSAAHMTTFSCKSTSDAQAGLPQKPAPPSSLSPQTSPAQRRLAALKARHEFAMHLQHTAQAVTRGGDAVHLIRGHAPADDAGLL